MKNKILITAWGVLFSTFLNAQSVGINTTTPDASAALDVKSTTKGLLIPRMTTVQRTAIITAATGLQVFDTDTKSVWFYNGTVWSQLSVGNNGWNLTGNAATNPSTNFMGTTDNQPLRFRVNNVWAGEIHPTSGNVFFGLGAGQSNTTGNNNTAVGDHALNVNTIGIFNSAYGYYALAANTTGGGNTANGYQTLYSNTIGYNNTANGIRALYSNTTGTNNTGNGNVTLYSNTTGISNTATGSVALYSNTTGSNNTANGYYALASNTTGDNNIAMGLEALNNNSTASQNTGIGNGALFTQSFSNGGTAWISGNTAVGYAALYANQPTSTSDGINNTAVGNLALTANTTGYDNTGIGVTALYSNTTGVENTAIGRQSLFFNTIGRENTATGYKALRNNTEGNYNTANGAIALYSNTTGSFNTADGNAALYNNTTGNRNTAYGYGAFYGNTTGSNNSVFGYDAFISNTTGNFNTAFGEQALINNTIGGNNTAVGSSSGNASGNLFNCVGIGNTGAFLNGASNQVILGNTSTVFIGGKVNWGIVSDERIKRNITEDVKGLDFIMKLRPVTYNISNDAISEVRKIKDTINFAGKYDGEKITYTGFLAQEVEQAANATGYNFSGYSKPATTDQLYTIRYAEFVVPLTKAMQEQQAIITNQQKQIDLLEKRLAALEVKNK
jgi:trimeric autotransporter adhesin